MLLLTRPWCSRLGRAINYAALLRPRVSTLRLMKASRENLGQSTSVHRHYSLFAWTKWDRIVILCWVSVHRRGRSGLFLCLFFSFCVGNQEPPPAAYIYLLISDFWRSFQNLEISPFCNPQSITLTSKSEETKVLITQEARGSKKPLKSPNLWIFTLYIYFFFPFFSPPTKWSS